LTLPGKHITPGLERIGPMRVERRSGPSHSRSDAFLGELLDANLLPSEGLRELDLYGAKILLNSWSAAAYASTYKRASFKK
jgi:hypothetical protein